MKTQPHQQSVPSNVLVPGRGEQRRKQDCGLKDQNQSLLSLYPLHLAHYWLVTDVIQRLG